MVTTAPRRSAVATAVLFCLSCFGLILYVWLNLGGSVPFAAKGYRFHVLFRQASQLYPAAQVRIAGVDVGRVVTVDRRGIYSDATIELDPPYAPVRRDARAILRQKTLLGEMFVALAPGPRSAPAIRDGGTLPRSQVEPIQPLDEVINSFDAPTRARFREMMLGLATTTSGAGAGELNAALGDAGPAAARLDDLVSTLDSQGAALQGLVRDTGTVLQAVSARQGDLQQLVVAGDRLLSTTAAHDHGLTATVRALPPFLAQARHTLAAADRTAAFAAPTLAALRPVAPLVRPALSKLLATAGPLEGFLHQLGPFLGLTIRTLPSEQRLLTTMRPFMHQLFPAVQQVVPVIAYLSAYRRELVAAMANLGAAMQATSPSDNGAVLHYLRTLLVFNDESELGPSQRLPDNRHNAYYAPGELASIGHGGVRASDCRNLSNPPPGSPTSGGGAPPCVVAPPWSFQGVPALFHRLRPARP
jgi:virulence factor Mce-like protein